MFDGTLDDWDRWPSGGCSAAAARAAVQAALQMTAWFFLLLVVGAVALGLAGWPGGSSLAGAAEIGLVMGGSADASDHVC